MAKTLLGIMAVAAGMIVLGCSNAEASPITWTLQSVAFADGGIASGSFVYDATTTSYSAFNVSTTGTGGIPATNFQYRSIFSGVPGSTLVLLDSNAADLTGAHDLTLRFTNALTNAGGTSALVLANGSFETTCGNAICGSVIAPSSFTTAGSVTSNPNGTATPEPATFALFAGAMVGGLLIGKRFRPNC